MAKTNSENIEVKKVTPPTKPKDMHWLVRPNTIKGLWVVGILLLMVMVWMGSRAHPHVTFGIEGTFGFFAWYGFAACIFMVVGAKVLGMVLKRKDTYYD